MFSKERLESVMLEQGVKNYNELRDLMGYGKEINLERYLNNSIPLNVLNKICYTLNVDRDYLMMVVDEPNIKPMETEYEEEPKKRGGGRQYSYISDPENYEKCEIDYNRLADSIDNVGWSAATLSEFIDDNIYNILNGNANSVLKKTMYNLSWALNQDKFYITGKCSIVNKKRTSNYQNKLTKQNYFVNSNFIRTFSDKTISDIADIVKIPTYILEYAKTDNLFVTDKIADKLTNALAVLNINERYGGIAVELYALQAKDDKKEDEEETPLTIKDIIKLADNLSADDIEKLGKYCTAEATKRKILLSLE